HDPRAEHFTWFRLSQAVFFAARVAAGVEERGDKKHLWRWQPIDVFDGECLVLVKFQGDNSRAKVSGVRNCHQTTTHWRISMFAKNESCSIEFRIVNFSCAA